MGADRQGGARASLMDLAMALRHARLDARAAKERHGERAGELPAHRQRAIAMLSSYPAKEGMPGVAACIGRSGIVDEFDQALVEAPGFTGTADQLRRLDGGYKRSSLPWGGKASTRDEIESAIEFAAMASIVKRERACKPDMRNWAARESKVERQLFNFRQARRKWSESGSVGLPPPAPKELSDRLLRAARTDSVYCEATGEEGSCREPFLVGIRRGSAEVDLFKALRLHGRARRALDEIESAEFAERHAANAVKQALLGDGRGKGIDLDIDDGIEAVIRLARGWGVGRRKTDGRA